METYKIVVKYYGDEQKSEIIKETETIIHFSSYEEIQSYLQVCVKNMGGVIERNEHEIIAGKVDDTKGNMIPFTIDFFEIH